MGYITKILKLKSVGISPEFLGNNLEDEVRKKATTLVVGNKTKHGLVLSVEKFKIDGQGEIRFDNTGFTRFDVILKVKMYVLNVGEKIKTIVKDVPTNGFYVDEPIDIFINTESRSSKSVGDLVSIKITKVMFNKGKFMILAVEI